MTHEQDKLVVEPGGRLNGTLRIPGDKSISHRAVMLGAIAEGTTEIDGFLDSADCTATIGAFRRLGVEIDGPQARHVTVHGKGLHGLRASSAPLELGNSGTSMRLLAGLLAGQAFGSVLRGDASLSYRPMRRIVDPLTAMGADIRPTSTGTAPLVIAPSRGLHGIHYDMPVSSAQVKSSLLLAGLYASGETRVTDPGRSRDHTERMLRAFGVRVQAHDATVAIVGPSRLRATRVGVPADISSAAFFIVGAAITPGSDLLLPGVGINPTRTGILTILRNMGARIETENAREEAGEPVADLRVRGLDGLHGTDIEPELVTLAIDEMPIVFVAAACADGETTIRGAAELRVKESDRISAMCSGLVTLGIDAIESADGATIRGGSLRGGSVEAAGDHRVAMAFAIAGLRSAGTVRIRGCENIRTSFPDFAATARRAGLAVRAEGAAVA
ncbi:MAG TPA: 3-phosphoshikimate 1-carboxyvinyltransferase [Nevskiaceae bacterium]